MTSPSTDPPSVTPAVPARSGPGCVVIGVLFLVVVVGGFVVGSILSRPDEPGEQSVTLDEGTIGAIEWRVDAVVDVQGDTCVFLFQDGTQLTGGCALTPQDATFDDETVVFGKAASDVGTVRVQLDTDDIVEIETVSADGMSGRFYVQVVEGDVDAVGVALP